MSNLGLYQVITTVSKKVGGPEKFLAIVGVAGYGIGKGIETAVKSITSRKKDSAVKGMTFTVTSARTDKQGLTFAVGEEYTVLESDGDTILINKSEDTNNPYYVSAKFLRTISDFPGRL